MQRLILNLFCALSISIIPAAEAAGLGSLLTHGATSGKLAKVLFQLEDDMAVTSIAWSPEGRYIAASSTQEPDVHIWDLERRSLVTTLQREAPGADINEISWSPDGRYVAVCDRLGKVRIFGTANWTRDQILTDERDMACRTTAFSRDGRRLAKLGSSLSIYSTDSWNPVKFVDLRADWALALPFNAIAYRGNTYAVVIGGGDRQGSDRRTDHFGHIWILGDSETVPSQEFPAYTKEPPDLRGDVFSMDVSPDGERVATGTQNGIGPAAAVLKASVHILNLNTGKLLGSPLDGRGMGQDMSVKYTSDGRYVIVGHGGFRTGHLIHVIDANTMQVVDEVKAANSVYGITVNPHNQQFAAAWGNHITIWSLPTDSGR